LTRLDGCGDSAPVHVTGRRPRSPPRRTLGALDSWAPGLEAPAASSPHLQQLSGLQPLSVAVIPQATGPRPQATQATQATQAVGAVAVALSQSQVAAAS